MSTSKSNFWSSPLTKSRITSDDVKMPEMLLGYFIGPFGALLSSGIFTSILQNYFTDVLKLDLGFLTTLQLVSTVLIVASNLIVGQLIEHTKALAGKARPWILLSALTLSVASVLMFIVPFEGMAKMVWIAIAYNLYYAVAYPIYNTANSTMIPVSTRDSKQRGGKRPAHVRPSAGISAVRICIRAVVVIILHAPLPALPAPGRGDTSGPPGELQRHGEIVLGILVDEDVQPRSKTDIVKIITGIVDRKGLQFGSPPVAHVKLRSVAHAQFVVEGLRDGWHFVLAGIDEGLRRSGPGRDGKQQEKKFLHCMTVRFSCKHNYFSRHNKISTADCAL